MKLIQVILESVFLVIIDKSQICSVTSSTQVKHCDALSPTERVTAALVNKRESDFWNSLMVRFRRLNGTRKYADNRNRVSNTWNGKQRCQYACTITDKPTLNGCTRLRYIHFNSWNVHHNNKRERMRQSFSLLSHL